MLSADVADSAIQVLGGYGYIADYQVELSLSRSLSALSDADSSYQGARHLVSPLPLLSYTQTYPLILGTTHIVYRI